MSNAENFQCDLKIFSVISVSLNNKGTYIFHCDYHCGFLRKTFSVFSVISMSCSCDKKFQCDFSVRILYSTLY